MALLVYTNTTVADKAPGFENDIGSFLDKVRSCKATYYLAAIQTPRGLHIASQRGWAEKNFPKVTLNDDCHVSFLSSGIMVSEVHTKSSQEGYFFYVRSLFDSYLISAQPLRTYAHAQWVVTENATFQQKSKEVGCFESEEIVLCLKANQTQ